VETFVVFGRDAEQLLKSSVTFNAPIAFSPSTSTISLGGKAFFGERGIPRTLSLKKRLPPLGVGVVSLVPSSGAKGAIGRVGKLCSFGVPLPLLVRGVEAPLSRCFKLVETTTLNVCRIESSTPLRLSLKFFLSFKRGGLVRAFGRRHL
jgi:hypothetical protein